MCQNSFRRSERRLKVFSDSRLPGLDLRFEFDPLLPPKSPPTKVHGPWTTTRGGAVLLSCATSMSNKQSLPSSPPLSPSLPPAVGSSSARVPMMASAARKRGPPVAAWTRGGESPLSTTARGRCWTTKGVRAADDESFSKKSNEDDDDDSNNKQHHRTTRDEISST